MVTPLRGAAGTKAEAEPARARAEMAATFMLSGLSSATNTHHRHQYGCIIPRMSTNSGRKVVGKALSEEMGDGGAAWIRPSSLQRPQRRTSMVWACLSPRVSRTRKVRSKMGAQIVSARVFWARHGWVRAQAPRLKPTNFGSHPNRFAGLDLVLCNQGHTTGHMHAYHF